MDKQTKTLLLLAAIGFGYYAYKKGWLNNLFNKAGGGQNTDGGTKPSGDSQSSSNGSKSGSNAQQGNYLDTTTTKRPAEEETNGTGSDIKSRSKTPVFNINGGKEFRIGMLA